MEDEFRGVMRGLSGSYHNNSSEKRLCGPEHRISRGDRERVKVRPHHNTVTWEGGFQVFFKSLSSFSQKYNDIFL